MSPKEPLVSVIIPVYNGERYLAEAVKSVLDQTYRPIEVIVVDDGSTDASADVAKKFSSSIRYVFRDHAGRSSARNSGIDLARGDLIAFLDADDLWVSDKLSSQVAVLEKDPGLDLVFGLIKNFPSPELPEAIRKKINCPEELMSGYSLCTLLCKKDIFSRVGRFDVSVRTGEFIDWFSRAKEKGVQTLMLPRLVTWRRLYRAGDKLAQDRLTSDYLKILKSSLDRKRAS